jgi:D-alanine-D-alanine ligase
MAKIRVAVLFGGKSNEHSISVATASGVLSAIDSSKYEVIPVGITRDGVFVPFKGDPATLSLANGLKTIEPEGSTIRFAMDGSCELFEADSSGKERSLGVIDVVMPMLHGPFGEDGTMQGFLELVGVPYVGNGVLGSAAAMDKEFSKALFKAAGIPSPDYAVVSASDMLNNPESALDRIKDLGKLPFFVKPARSGSSVGITKVDSMKDIPAALTEAFKHDDKVIIEVGVVGREIECGVRLREKSRFGGASFTTSRPSMSIVMRRHLFAQPIFPLTNYQRCNKWPERPSRPWAARVLREWISF